MTQAPAPLRVVPARLEDAPALLALRKAVLAEGRWFATHVDEHSGGLDQARATIHALGQQPNGLMLAAWEGDDLVGLLAVHGERLARMRHLGRLEMMVAAPFRGRGIGGAMLASCLRWAEANPMLRKISLAVFADNDRAVALYQSHGFVQEGRREGEYLLEDGSVRADLLMAREV